MAEDSRWKLAGAIGVPPPTLTGQPRQVMTQGLGFPLRPVDGTPPTGFDEIIDDLNISEGAFMTWHGDFTQGLLYPNGSMVRDGQWTMIANKPTYDKAAPIPVGTPEWALPDVPAWTDEDQLAVIYSGHQYQFTVSGWVRSLRIWAPTLSGTTNYRIIILDTTDPNNPKYQTIEEPVLTEDDWTILVATDIIVTAGTILIIYIDALNSGGDTIVAGGWAYNGADNNAPPASPGGWNRHSQQNLIRIDKTDLDATDRATELLGMVPGTNIVFVATTNPQNSYTYETLGPAVDQGTFVSYEVALRDTGPGGPPTVGQPTTMTATVPVAQLTDYVRLPAGVPTPSWATVTGYLAYDGVDQGAGADGFGVDLFFDEAGISEDWDIVSYNG